MRITACAAFAAFLFAAPALAEPVALRMPLPCKGDFPCPFPSGRQYGKVAERLNALP
jgi:hypothetical protein